MSDILIGVIVFGLVFGAAIFGMFLGRNLRVLEQKVNANIKHQTSDIRHQTTRCYGSLTTEITETTKEEPTLDARRSICVLRV